MHFLSRIPFRYFRSLSVTSSSSSSLFLHFFLTIAAFLNISHNKSLFNEKKRQRAKLHHKTIFQFIFPIKCRSIHDEEIGKLERTECDATTKRFFILCNSWQYFLPWFRFFCRQLGFRADFEENWKYMSLIEFKCTTTLAQLLHMTFKRIANFRVSFTKLTYFSYVVRYLSLVNRL